MNTVTWDELAALAAKKFFGDLEIETSTGPQRGPVKSISVEGDALSINLFWMAGRRGPGDPWRSVRLYALTFFERAEHKPHWQGGSAVAHIESGRLRLFQRLHPGTLDPSEVSDLPLEDVRAYRAWEYDLPLDASWNDILKEVDSRAGKGQVEARAHEQVKKEAARSKQAA